MPSLLLGFLKNTGSLNSDSSITLQSPIRIPNSFPSRNGDFVIGLVAALATLIAMLGARWIGKRMGRGSEFVAGFVLIGLGLWTALKAEGLLAF